MKLAAFLLAWTALAGQDLQTARDRLLARLREGYADLPEPERAALAERLAAAVAATRRAGHDPAAVLDRVDWTLAQGDAVSAAVRASAEGMSDGLERWGR